MKKENNHPFWGWGIAAAVGALALAGWCWQPEVLAQSSAANAANAAKPAQAAPATRAAVRPAAVRPAAVAAKRPNLSGVLAAAFISSPEASLKQGIKVLELLVPKDLQQVSDDFIRNVGRGFFPQLKNVKLHRAAQLLPAMIRPFGVDLSKPIGVLAWRMPNATQVGGGRFTSKIVPIVMISVERTRFLASLTLLGLSPRVQSYKGVSLLTLGKGGKGSAFGALIGDRFYFTTRTPSPIPFLGLKTEGAIRNFLVKLAKGKDPFQQAFAEAGQGHRWKSVVAGDADVAVVVPNFTRFTGFSPNPVLRYLKSVGAIFSFKNGMKGQLFVKLNPVLKPVFAPFVPGPNPFDAHLYLPANMLIFAQSHFHMDKLLALPQKLATAKILPPMMAMMAQGRLQMVANSLKYQGFDVDKLKGMLSGQFVSGSMWDRRVRSELQLSPHLYMRGHMHGLFAMVGLRSKADAGKILGVLMNAFKLALNKDPAMAKRITLTRETTQGLASIKIKLKRAAPYYVFVKDKVLGFAGSTATRDELVSVWTGAAPSLAQHLQRHPAQAAVYGKSNANYGAVLPNVLRELMVDLSRNNPQRKLLKFLGQRVERVVFNTHFRGASLDTSLEVGLAKRARFPIPARFIAPKLPRRKAGASMSLSAVVIVLATTGLAGLPIAAIAASGAQRFMRLNAMAARSRRHVKPRAPKSAGRLVMLNMKALAEGAISYFDAEHSNMNGDPLPRHFPGHQSGVADGKRFSITTPAAKPCANGKAMYPKNTKIWNKAPWRSLKFAITKPHYFQYTYITEGKGNSAKFTIIARADRDCDGKMSTYKQVVSVNKATGEAERTNTVVTNAGE